jgi:hypothetical protein
VLVSEVQEILERYLEYTVAIIFESNIEILLSQLSNLWAGVEEGTEPDGEHLAHVGSKCLGALLDKLG